MKGTLGHEENFTYSVKVNDKVFSVRAPSIGNAMEEGLNRAHDVPAKVEAFKVSEADK